MFCHAHAADAAVAKCTGCGALLCGACRRRGEWTREDVREARGIWFACAAVLLLLAGARASGAEVSLWLTWPALLVPLGVGLALGERSNRVDARAEEAVEPKPGETVDRR